MQRRNSRRRHVPPWSFGIVGFLVAVVLFASVGPPALLLQHVTVCGLGPEIGTYVVWTPGTIINKPYETNISVSAYYGTWNYTFTSGTLSVGTLPVIDSGPIGGEGDYGPQGGLLVDFQNHNWTFFRTVNETVVGTAPGPCSQPYVAEVGAGQGCGGGFVIPLLPDNSTDSNEPHVWNGTEGLNGSEPVSGCAIQTAGTYVWFDSSFHAGGTGNYAPVTWNLCHSTGTFSLELLGLAQIPIRVTVPYQGRDISATGFLNWYGNSTGARWLTPPFEPEASAFYEVPGGWNWTLAPVGPAAFAINPTLPLPSLVAFERSAC